MFVNLETWVGCRQGSLRVSVSPHEDMHEPHTASINFKRVKDRTLMQLKGRVGGSVIRWWFRYRVVACGMEVS